MTRTNIDLDDELVSRAMQRYNLRTKREVVDLALRQLVGERLSAKEVLELEGSGWQCDLDDLRSSRPASL